MRNPLSQLTDTPKADVNKFGESPFSVELQESMQELSRQLQTGRNGGTTGSDNAITTPRSTTTPGVIDFSEDIYNSDGR